MRKKNLICFLSSDEGSSIYFVPQTVFLCLMNFTAARVAVDIRNLPECTSMFVNTHSHPTSVRVEYRNRVERTRKRQKSDAQERNTIRQDHFNRSTEMLQGRAAHTGSLSVCSFAVNVAPEIA